MDSLKRLRHFLWGHLVVTLVLGAVGAASAEAMMKAGKHRKGKKHTAAGKGETPAPKPAGPGALAATESKADGAAGLSRKKAKEQARLAQASMVLHLKTKDLRPGVYLRGYRFPRGYDLSGKNLRMADLSFAGLRGVNMKGTRLEGARMFGADIRGAIGIDLSEAEIHPFFETRAGEPVGAVTYFQAKGLGRLAGEPGQVAAGRGQILAWLSSDRKTAHFTTATGARYALDSRPGSEFTAITVDSRDQLHLFSTTGTTVVPLKQILDGNDSQDLFEYDRCLPGKLLAIATDGELGYWISSPDQYHFISHFSTGIVFEPFPNGECGLTGSGNRMIAAPQAQMGPARLWFADPARDSVQVLVNGSGQPPGTIPLPKGSRARGLAEAADGAVWCTLSGLGSLVRIDPASAADPGDWKLSFFPLAEGKDTVRTPHAIVRGEDGNLWFTDPLAGIIGRATADGAITEFPLGPGVRPLELIPSGEGRMYFTVAGQDRIGAIRTVAVPADEAREAGAGDGKAGAGEGKAGAGAGFESAPYRPRPQRAKPLTRQERWERAWRVEHLAGEEAGGNLESKPDPGDGKAAESKEPSWSEVAGRIPVFEARQELPPPAAGEAPSARHRLAAMGVTLQSGTVECILAKHGWGRNAAKSQFAEAFSTAEGFEEMLAAGLAKVRIGQDIDADGRFLTHFSVAGAGLRNDGKASAETGRVKLVTSGFWDRSAGRWRHDVVNAYPD